MRRPALAVLALTVLALAGCGSEPAEETTGPSAAPAAATSPPTTYAPTPEDVYLIALEGRGLTSDLTDTQMVQIGNTVCTFIPTMTRDEVVETITAESTQGNREAAEIIVDSAKQQLCRSSEYLAAAPAVVPPAPAEPEMTVSQSNALDKAESYLSFTSFSRTGLIGQLEYDGFSTDDATFAVDNVTVDWMVQAEKKAQSYLEFTSFSRSGLIGQLEYDGFTTEQAEHGANSVGL